MKKLHIGAMAAIALLAGCGGGSKENKSTLSGSGTLNFIANGEDFIRQGFTSKDGWQISFDTVLVSIANVAAHQAAGQQDSHEHPGTGDKAVSVSLPGSHLVDLAAGDESALPLNLGTVRDAAAGNYNALSFTMTPIATGPYKGAGIVTRGRAVKNGRTIDFEVGFATDYRVACGGYVGEQIKGILASNSEAEIEMTFHFDHLFGDAETPQDDPLNRDALGFEFISSRAMNGKFFAMPERLGEILTAQEKAKLAAILRTLPHVGEGHCHCE